MALIYVVAIAEKPQKMMREAGDGAEVWDGLNIIGGKAEILSYFSL